MIDQSIEQTMQEAHRGVRERLGMSVTPKSVAIPRLMLTAPAPASVAPKLVLKRIERPKQDDTWRDIIAQTLHKHEVTIGEFMGIKRSRNFVAARREAAYRMRTERGMSYPDIARRMGYKEHSAVMHLVSCHLKDIGEPPLKSKDALKSYRKVRNATILQRLRDGAYVAELSKEYDFSPAGIRRVASELGFDFSQGAEARAAKAMASQKEAWAVQTQALQVKKQAEREAEAERRAASIAKAMAREKAETQRFAEQYYSYRQAAAGEGMCKSTIRSRAIKHGIMFRNTAVPMPLRKSK